VYIGGLADNITRMAENAASTASSPRLRRALTLWDLVLYGVIVLQPTAPMPVYGVVSDRGHGHVVTTILIALVAMLFTAIAYGRMARAYPSAGSAFTYVGQEINPALGYITGWSMVMDYMLNPLICTSWCSSQASQFAPGVPFWMWAVFFVAVFTALNLRGIKTSARVNAGLATGMGVVVAFFFIAAARYIFGHPHEGAAFFTRPFFDPATFQTSAVLGGTSIAVLTYIGFDGISTLSEEVENPRRNILLATVLTCVVVGFLSAAECYAAQLVWPASEPFPNEVTAFVDIAGRAAKSLSWILGFTLVVATFGSGMGSQLGAARLLYGMGRSNALPQGFFGAVDSKRRIPRNNVLFVAVIALIGAFFIPFDLGAEMLNFGALIAFMGVNAASFMRYYVRAPEKKLANLLPPMIGFTVCLLLWLNLSRPAQLWGGLWMLAGIAFGAWKTRGFRGKLIDFNLPPDEA
jgi:putrescine importer